MKDNHWPKDLIKTFIESSTKRMDGEFGPFGYKIYWCGKIIRIDLSPKEEKE